MSINRNLLLEKVKRTLYSKRHQINFDLSLILDLIHKTIFNDSTKGCIIKGKKNNWDDLPKDKSLFTTKSGCGLPIGNLTSQLFGNVFLNDLDHFVKRDLKIKYYGRYVDDFVLIHRSKNHLKLLIKTLSDFLLSTFNLILHPNKIYLQHISKGVKYLGAGIKPHRIYITDRTKGNFFEAIQNHNAIIRDHKPNREEQEKFRSVMNSYLGIMSHYKTYKMRKHMVFNLLSGRWLNYGYFQGGINKINLW